MNTTKARLRFNFWLDIRRDDEFAVAEQIQILKRQRAFAKTVRDGIRLICDLRAGSTDVLIELFPRIAQKLTPPTPPSDDGLRRDVEAIKAILTGNTPLVTASAGAARPLMSRGASGPKQLSVPKFDLPRFDDEHDAETLVLSKDTSTDSASNFLNSMLALQQ